jgi:uncharacterized protein YPO0396
MKLLKRVKLINWHYFTNTTMKVEGSTLVTGDNGSGKSTILDAIQYVLVADLRYIRFNISANDNTDRDLLGYVRCKTGSESQGSMGYMRAGDVTSYVVLEFYDDVKDQYFLLGAVVDAYKEGGYTSSFFKIEDCELRDELFLDGMRPRNIREFKRYVKPLRSNVYPTAEQYKEDMLVKLGGLSPRFFSVFVRALSFKAITNIRDFVYSYILDQKDVNIDVMRENFQRYNEYSQLVQQTKQRLSDLEDVRSQHAQLLSQKETALVQDYVILRSRRDDIDGQCRTCEQQLSSHMRDMEAKEQELQDARQQVGYWEEQYGKLRDALASNSVYRLMQDLQREIASMQDKIDDLSVKRGDLLKTADYERQQTELFLQMTQGLDQWISPEQRQSLQMWGKALSALEAAPDDGVDAVKLMLPSAKDIFADVSARIDGRLWQLRSELSALNEEEKAVREILENLQHKKLTYGKNVTALRELLRDKLRAKTGKDIIPNVLCELIDIKDERWRNAVEGFLNTQRFDLIVEPQYFDYCLSVYERYKKEYGIHGVGLVNTGKVIKFLHDAVDNSLATEVISDNKYAMAYVNRLMGNVIKCENEQQLKQYGRSITPTCMTYSNNTARQIDFKVYETPYIGKGALIKQKENNERKLADLLEQKEALKKEISDTETLKRSIEGKDERCFKIADRLPVLGELSAVQQKMRQKQDELDSLDTSAVNDLEQQMKEAKVQLDAAQGRIAQISRDMGQLESLIRHAEQTVEALKQQLGQADEGLKAFAEANGHIMDKAQKRYEQEIKKRLPKDIGDSFSVARKATDTMIADQLRLLERAMQAYNDAYRFWGRIDGNDITDYQKEYDKLIKSELPQYEEKIAIAQKQAEEEFKDHFLYKLRENIEQAQNEFAYLNDALKDVRFGNDSYRFLIYPREEYRRFYDMIMDASATSQNFSIFDLEFKRKHQEAMDELFERIIINTASDDLEQSIALYTDYRTFMDYDIRISTASASGQTEEYLFSRVCREKSGGETQTPYYVAIVASFAQLYHIGHNSNSMRLIAFDEAFNRMDGERINTMLQFIKDMGMQVLIAAPTEKCQFITPYMDTTLLVLRDGYSSWIENYRRLMELPQKEAV